ncbi:hypothetical protein HF072_12835 [Bacillus sp. RO3]|nr:hypothetical protein [Bacillus sp. RO3]
MITITKTVTTKYKVSAVSKNFLVLNENNRMTRTGAFGAFNCFMCDRPLGTGDQLEIIETDKGQKVVCTQCAEEIEKKLEEECLNE